MLRTKFFNVRASVRNLAQIGCNKSGETNLKTVLKEKIKTEQEKVKAFRGKYGKTKVGDVTVDMMYGGMRGIKALVYETSLLDLEKGILYRGLTIKEMQECLPKAPCGSEPLPESIFWLLITGDVPNDAQVNYLSREWAKRSELPKHVTTLLDNLPESVHPMAKFSAAVTALSSESVFSKAYFKKVPKTQYWEYVYEDAMNLIGKIIVIAARIYRDTYRGGSQVGGIDCQKDWSYNMCQMMGFENSEFHDLMRMYLSVHSDHEGGNVSAHAVHLCGSALSDPYLAFASGLNGLAGPLHGLANQESLEFLIKLSDELGDKYTEDQLKQNVEKILKAGQVVPGYGHAILRITDPRYTAMRDFALKHFPEDPMFKLVSNLYKVVPPILKATGKVANPWPNVDNHSGVLLQHYGLKEMSFYTVLFGVARALGTMAGLVWDRAHNFPIERPKSLTTEALMKLVGASKSKCE